MTREHDGEIEELRAALAAAEARAAASTTALAAAETRERVLQRRLDGLGRLLHGIVWESYFQQSPADSTVDYVSEAIEPLSGYSAEEWKRPNFWVELVHPDDRPRALADASAVFQQGSGTASYRWITRDGRTLWVTSRMELIRDAAGAPIGLRGVTMDETEVKRAEAERVEMAMREEVMRAQEETLLALSTPLVPIDDDLVAMPLIGTLDPRRVERVQQALLDGVIGARARTVILDLTGVPELDPQTADALIRVARSVALLGAEAVLTGIRPEVASALVDAGVDLAAIVTRGTLKAGIAHALGRRRRR